MDQTEQTFETVQPGQFVLSNSSDYVQVPAGEPLKAHISRVEVTKSKNFDNPEILEDTLVVRFSLDEAIEGQGQVYTAWLKPSIHPKSKMYKLLTAIYGVDIPKPFDVTDLDGQPVRIILTEGVEKNGRVRQYVEAYLKPAAGQTKVERQEAEEVMDDLDAAFDAAIAGE